MKPDFSLSPFLVIWEMTRACELACVHCRASAIPRRDPGELSTQEAFALLRSIRAFSWKPTEPADTSESEVPGSLPRPVVVLTGGDPVQRPDLYEIVEYGTRLGLRMTMTPSGTPRVTPEVIRKLKDAGLQRLAISLDSADASRHDAFRKVPGSFEWSLGILNTAHDIGLETQVNTTMTRFNLDEFSTMAGLVAELGAALWSVFYLVPTGRGRREDELTAEEYEDLFGRMAELSRTAPFDIKSTAAPHFRRYLVQQGLGKARGGRHAAGADVIGRSFRAVNDGDGLVFISHTGDACPSGFLPVSAGNVRQHSLVDLYRNSPLFTDLRDRDLLKGKCGVCEFRHICGGSRARAYGRSGDFLESDPCCSYVPPPYARLVELGSAVPPERYFEGW